MDQAVFQSREFMDWGVAARPIIGGIVSGDLHVAQAFDHGMLLAVIDGVGHGPEAIAAAQVAVSVLEQHAAEPVISLIQRCHKVLAPTRGAVMTVVSLNTRENTLTWLGVGNVEGLLVRTGEGARPACESVLLSSGLVGYQLPALHARVTPVRPGDLLILATDGIGGDFMAEAKHCKLPQALATRILNRHYKGTDDALVLAARYIGNTA